MNALAHCVEVVWSPRRTPEAEAVALAGARRIAAAFPLVMDDPGDLAVRAAMLEGAVLGGRCLQNATMGVHHGLAQLVGGRTGIPHGLANAVILPHAIRFNAEAVPDAVAKLGEALGTDDVAGAVAALVVRLGLPTQLGIAVSPSRTSMLSPPLRPATAVWPTTPVSSASTRRGRSSPPRTRRARTSPSPGRPARRCPR